MKFAYYQNLSSRQKRVYDRSDAVRSIRLPSSLDLGGTVRDLEVALRHDDRAATERAASELVYGMLGSLGLAPVQVRVLAARPSTSREELHGQYEFGGSRSRPVITVWMRTAQRKQVVAFRTFLRTLLHEVTHHLDYEVFHFADSLHTQGFYRRAESLFDRLTAGVELAGVLAEKPPASKAVASRQRQRVAPPVQAALPFE